MQNAGEFSTHLARTWHYVFPIYVNTLKKLTLSRPSTGEDRGPSASDKHSVAVSRRPALECAIWTPRALFGRELPRSHPMQLTQAQRKGLRAILDRPLAIGCRLMSRGTFNALARRGLAERRRPEP
jgi:hypothetical protein